MYKTVTYFKEDRHKIERYKYESDFLWSDHMTYTRNAIISLANELLDADAIVSRLLKNQEQIGALIQPYYDLADVTMFINLLKEHISLVKTIVLNPKTNLDDYNNLEKNGIEIVNLMQSMNPWYWSKTVIWPLWQSHLNLVTMQISARRDQLWDEDIKACDSNHIIISDFSKVYAKGVIYQNLEKFSEY